MNPINATNSINAITTFLELCNPSCTSLSVSPSEEDWAAVTELSQKHGLTPLFSYRLGSLGLSLPEDLKRKWIMAYLYQMGQERKARQQIKELKEVLDPEGIPFILLKGTSAMLRLYPDQGLRTFCDIDILIPQEKAGIFKGRMAQAGYKPSVVLNSPEEEEVWKFESHLPAIKKEDSLPIETHLSILGRKEKIATSAILEPKTRLPLQAEPACSKPFRRRQVSGEKSDCFFKGVEFWPKAGRPSVESASPDSTEVTYPSAFSASRTRPSTNSSRVGGETFNSSFSLWNELWQQSEETEIDGTKVYHLGKEHFVIHMLLHFEKHLRTEGNLEIKSLVDMLHTVRTWAIDWERLWKQARRWKVQEVISPVVATLNHHW